MTHYEVFRECFPELKLTEEHYDKLAEEKLCRAFELPEGFALVKENELRLLCVLPQKRGNGAGTRLFRSAEDYIRSRGYERMEIGGAGSGLLIGAPEDTCGFFEIASFCILGYNDATILNDGAKRMGSIGCVGTVPDFRRRGIGLEMVAEAAKLLLQRGCDDIFIHYTAVYDWYSRLGFKTRLFLKLGGKKL